MHPTRIILVGLLAVMVGGLMMFQNQRKEG